MARKKLKKKISKEEKLSETTVSSKATVASALVTSSGSKVAESTMDLKRKSSLNWGLTTSMTNTKSKSNLRSVSRDFTSLTKSKSNIKDLNLRKESLPPTTGSLLLEWVQRRMSFVSIDETGDKDDNEYLQIFKQTKEKRKKSVSQDLDRKLDKKMSTSRHKRDKSGDIRGSKYPKPPGFEDEIVTLIKKRRESLVSQQFSQASQPKEIKPSSKRKRSGPKGKDKTTPPSPPKKKLEPEIIKDEKVMQVEDTKALEKEELLKEAEQIKRLSGLRHTYESIENIEEYFKKLQSKRMKEVYWKLYVDLRELPIVNHISDVTTYLLLWKDTINQTTPEEASKRTKDGLKLLKVLDEFIENPKLHTKNKLDNYRWLREWLRQQLGEMMEAMTYKILRNIEGNMNHLNLKTGDFNYTDPRFVLCLWLKFQLPKPLFNPRKPPPPAISLKLDCLKMSLDLPPSINGESMVIRVLYLTYDHLSDFCESFQAPPKPEYYDHNLVDVVEKEWKVKKKYKVQEHYRKQYEEEVKKREKLEEEHPNLPDLPPLPEFKLPEVDLNGDIPNVPPTRFDPTPEEYAETMEELIYAQMKKCLHYSPEKFEINLRKYRIIGGVYIMDLFYQPPQPQNLVTIDLNVSAFVLPKGLVKVPFHEKYETPPPSDEQKTPEELELALKMQEEGFEKLMSVTITLPTQVMYLEPPVVCMWEEESKMWSTRDVHDVKQNEEKGSVSFRTGRFGIVALASLRYSNFPYQTWEIRPDEEGSITFQLTTAIILFEFNVKGSKITVTQLQNGPTDALQEIVSKSLTLNELKRILRESGVDIFPDHDAFCYVEGSCEKHWPTEHICYYHMALLAACYNFAWSRWNATEGFRSIVMQMRVNSRSSVAGKNLQSLVQVTPLRAAFINCTDVTPIFCDEPIEGSKFCCNLWYLMKATSTIYVRSKLRDISQETVYTMAHLLMGTRILSFC